jgi:hypothetical protein
MLASRLILLVCVIVVVAVSSFAAGMMLSPRTGIAPASSLHSSLNTAVQTSNTDNTDSLSSGATASNVTLSSSSSTDGHCITQYGGYPDVNSSIGNFGAGTGSAALYIYGTAPLDVNASSYLSSPVIFELPGGSYNVNSGEATIVVNKC